MICPQLKNSQFFISQVLLMSKILVANNEKVESRLLRPPEEVSILDLTPSHLHGRKPIMALGN